ncbi:hypothetical protein FRB90_003747 [Tulasnella sp. 427]|nr:hypothetical protein FRB90_003747 [Tulasnella sp. 427]
MDEDTAPSTVSDLQSAMPDNLQEEIHSAISQPEGKDTSESLSASTNIADLPEPASPCSKKFEGCDSRECVSFNGSGESQTASASLSMDNLAPAIGGSITPAEATISSLPNVISNSASVQTLVGGEPQSGITIPSGPVATSAQGVGEEAEADHDQAYTPEPCEDISTAIEECLEACSDFRGSHFYAHTFGEAPNPGLRLLPESELGRIGLPLNEHEAQRIWSRCLGNNPNTVGGVLEIPANTVRIDNPVWIPFVEGIRQQVCKSLGVADGGKYPPRLDLISLVIHAPGPSSYALPPAATQGTNGIPLQSFGSVLVTLPSPHIGGITQVNYGAAINLYDPSPTSYLGTSVLAWYSSSSDVRLQDVAPISAGYRLSLRYSLNHVDPATPVPYLPSPTSQVEHLRHTLLSWRNQGWAGLQKIVYLLSGDYSVERLRTARLREVVIDAGDLRKVEFLDAIAKQCGFNVGLGTIETIVEGTPDYMGNFDDWDEEGQFIGEPMFWDRSEPTPEPTPSQYTMGEVDSQESSCLVLVDVRTGEIVAEDLEDIVDDVEGHVPEDLIENLESHHMEEEEYGGWEGNGSGSLKRTYRATVLVVWPSFRDDEFLEGQEYVAERAFEALEDNETVQPDQEELNHFAFLLEYASREQRWSTDPQILPALTNAAMRWNNKELFEQALEKCHAEEKVKWLGARGVLDAVTTFGLEYMKPIIERTLQKDPSNADRLHLIDSLRLHLVTHRPELLPWTDESEKAVIENLAPLQKSDIPRLFDYLRKHGDLSTFTRTIIKQVNRFTPAHALCDLATSLHQETKHEIGTGFLKSPDDVESAARLVRQILSQAASNTDYFPNLNSHSIVLSQGGLELALSHVKMCLEMGCERAVEKILEKLDPNRFSKIQPGRTRETTQYATSLVAFLPQLQPVLSNHNDGNDVLRPGATAFYRSLIAWYAKGLEYAGFNGPSTAELLKVVQLALDIGSLSVLEESVVPAIAAHLRNDTSIKKLIHHLHSRQSAIATSPQMTQSFVKIIGDLLNAMISRNVRASSTVASLLEWVDLCLDVHHLGACAQILARLRQEMATMNKTTLSSVLHFILEMVKRVESRNFDLFGLETRPLVLNMGLIVMTWVDRHLSYAEVGSVAAELKRCSRPSCRSCGLLAHLLPLQLERNEVKLRGLGITEGRHVDQQLWRSRASATCNWSLPSGRGGDFTLKMQDGYYKASPRWKLMRDHHLKIFQSAKGGETFWQQLLGPQGYHSFLQRLDVASIHPRPALNLSMRPNAGPSTSATNAAGKRPYSQTQTGSQPVPQTPRPNAPAAKRPRLVNENIVVIDLTSP